MKLKNISTTNIVVEKLRLDIQPNEIIEIDDEIAEEYLKQYIDKKILIKLNNTRLRTNKYKKEVEKEPTIVIEDRPILQNIEIENKQYRQNDGMRVPEGFKKRLEKIREEVRNKVHSEIEVTTKKEVKELSDSESELYFGKDGVFNCKNIRGGRLSNRFIPPSRIHYIDEDPEIPYEIYHQINKKDINIKRRKKHNLSNFKCIVPECSNFARKNSKYCKEHYIAILKSKINEVKKKNKERYKKENINIYIKELKKVKRMILKDKYNMNLRARKRVLQGYIKKFAIEHFHIDNFGVGVIVSNKANIDKDLIVIPNVTNTSYWVGSKADFNKLLKHYCSKYKEEK